VVLKGCTFAWVRREVTPFIFPEFIYVFVTGKDYISEAYEDCNCSRGLEGMHVRLSKARSDSLLFFQNSLTYYVTEKGYMSEAHEDCNCSRGLKGMHACLSKARSDSLLFFQNSFTYL